MDEWATNHHYLPHVANRELESKPSEDTQVSTEEVQRDEEHWEMTWFLPANKVDGSCNRTRRAADEGHEEAAAIEVWSRTATLWRAEMSGLLMTPNRLVVPVFCWHSTSFKDFTTQLSRTPPSFIQHRIVLDCFIQRPIILRLCYLKNRSSTVLLFGLNRDVFHTTE